MLGVASEEQNDIKISNSSIKVEEKQQFFNSKDHFDVLAKLKISEASLESLKRFSSIELSLSSFSSVQEAANIYFDRYLKLFQENQTLNTQMASAIQKNNQLVQYYHRLKNLERKDGDMPRRKRRHAQEISRKFPCPSQKCRKSYGTEGSLAQHVKIKHTNFYTSGEFDIYLQNIIAQMKEDEMKEKSETIDRDD